MDDGSPSIFSDGWWESDLLHLTWRDVVGHHVFIWANDLDWMSLLIVDGASNQPPEDGYSIKNWEWAV
jgi:hypothetical protein